MENEHDDYRHDYDHYHHYDPYPLPYWRYYSPWYWGRGYYWPDYPLYTPGGNGQTLSPWL